MKRSIDRLMARLGYVPAAAPRTASTEAIKIKIEVVPRQTRLALMQQLAERAGPEGCRLINGARAAEGQKESPQMD